MYVHAYVRTSYVYITHTHIQLEIVRRARLSHTLQPRIKLDF